MGASLGIAFGGPMIGSPVALGLAIGAFAAPARIQTVGRQFRLRHTSLARCHRLLPVLRFSIHLVRPYLVFDGLRNLKQGRTTFVIAHCISTIRNADCIIVLDQGRIVERGRHAELVAMDGLYARMDRMQNDDEGRGRAERTASVSWAHQPGERTAGAAARNPRSGMSEEFGATPLLGVERC